MKLGVIFPALALMLACAPGERCLVNTTRCAGPVAQVCGSDERWADNMDCRQVAEQSTGAWSCQPLDGGGHTCLPDDADGGIGGGR
jgi:hypothetical protein